MSDMNGSVPAQQPPSRVPGDGGEERTEDELSLALRLVTRAGDEPSRSFAIMEKAPNSAFTFKTLTYIKQVLAQH